ncbi:heme lyase NrfEFG subunit NrfF [Vibrio sp. SCSIO 43137]|uniref:heme lyase NrfEFG subunit NrfF n=1 Tax=Vibrio sp. SCSIO 43137 TaxID=3021011 RepID=UPI002307E123|nr:heme lyase NrfEFG subunit NrfF [Vibrio sp. SCSIO 43137]WCE28359.1 heme lyase NrfEFG subunit NrfF [Vibrio sp. SCSIO 43137]
MKNQTATFSAFILLLISVSSFAAQNSNQTIFYDDNKDVAIKVDLFEFDSEEQRQNAVHLAKTLRCPQCQNQNLVESNSPVAKDLRLKVYQMIKQGHSDEEVVAYMTERFGDFVLYDPALNSKTYLLWFIPVLLLLTGVGLAIRSVKRK